MKLLPLAVLALSLTSGFAHAEELTQTSAESFCKAKGQRLPTARELAEKAMAKSAKGILEVTEAADEVPAGYYLITAQEANGEVDKFYYSHQGFVSKSEDSQCVWASSVNPEYPLTYGHYEIKFNPSTGRIDDHVMTARNSYSKCSVKCVE